ncbi:MAG TPA: hypothetical protein VGO61_16480 [Steroidobacteraceae bacterium]|jgi:hypothetical protein|nr:hypothetical protein [Steroidobacteraceae bacterium]
MNAKFLAFVLSFIGTALALWVAIFKQAHPSLDFENLVEIAGPWFLLDVLLLCFPWYRGVSLAAAAMLAFELFIFWGVFIGPKSSTDAIAYVFKPFIQLLVLLPVGLVVGRVLDKRSHLQSST